MSSNIKIIKSTFSNLKLSKIIIDYILLTLRFFIKTKSIMTSFYFS